MCLDALLYFFLNPSPPGQLQISQRTSWGSFCWKHFLERLKTISAAYTPHICLTSASLCCHSQWSLGRRPLKGGTGTVRISSNLIVYLAVFRWDWAGWWVRLGVGGSDPPALPLVKSCRSFVRLPSIHVVSWPSPLSLLCEYTVVLLARRCQRAPARER